jgi:DNA-binding PadR family transcriptional regulator
VRRKPGRLLPLELAICRCAAALKRRGRSEFHGYEIARQLKTVEGRPYLAAFGTLYRALGRLDSMGVLESRWEDPAIPARENRPGRRLYTLTAAGEEAVNRQAAQALEERRRRARRRLAPA